MNDTAFKQKLIQASTKNTSLSINRISSQELAQLADEFNLDLHSAHNLALQYNIVPDRYLRNFKALSTKDQQALAKSKVLIVGAGGLGGYISESLARTGVGQIIIADGDVFEESNLNRQVLSTQETLGTPKVHAAKRRIQSINPFVKCQVIPEFLDESSLPPLLSKVDLVIDALGGIGFRQVLLEHTVNSGLTLISGAVAGWTGFAATITPGHKGPVDFWLGQESQSAEIELGCLAPIVSLIASIQCAEAINILTQRKANLVGKIFFIDLKTMTSEIFDLNDRTSASASPCL
jgi:molybdopterin/thiamine biosynthesis adenylyltransferase